ncbi:MAG: PrsW family intramembrane metalloprotease [Xanthomonadales bacterium]|nr:PrsW family intramembrane metalloprotease [Xanthomonadales bacterium]
MTDYLLMLLPVALPVVFWSAYHLHVDRHLPEPPANLALAFVLGIGSFFLGALAYRLLGFLGLRYDAFALARDDLPGLFVYAVVAIGLIEETVKLLPFLLFVVRFRAFDEPIDGIVYASFIALGFAAVENMLYVPQLDSTTAYARGFVAPVLHIVFASIWGYYLGRAWLRGRNRLAAIGGGLAISAFIHGVYDFAVLGLPRVGLPIAATLITALWIWRLLLIRDLHQACRSDEANR